MSNNNVVNHLKKFCTPLLAAGIALTLAGCGGNDNKNSLLGVPAPEVKSSSSSAGGGSGVASSAANTSSAASSAAGGIIKDPATNQPISVALNYNQQALAFGATKEITLTFTSESGQPVEPNFALAATSSCINAKKATIGSPVLTNNIATFTYTNKGCQGDDYVAFTLGAGAVSQTAATAKVLNLAETVSSIVFKQASPVKIYIAGEGTARESVLVFEVIGQGGEPLANQEIAFSHAGTSGGLTIVNSTATSDDKGRVEVRVKAGTVPMNAAIKAYHAPSRVEVISSSLEVSAAMPVLSKFSVGSNKFNIRSFNRINEETAEITTRISDSAGNPVPDGTLVRFESREGGSIESCKTLAGTCSSKWSPGGQQAADGRVQVMAYVSGVEEFKDINSNNVFDDGDTFTDLPEPFSDDNQNGLYDAGEFFVDTNSNGKRDLADGKWNGVNCQHSTLCTPNSQLVTLSQQLTLILSRSAYSICELGDFTKTFWVQPKGILSVGGMYISDGNQDATNSGHPCNKGNPLPNGSKISFSVSGGAIKAGGSYTIGANEFLPHGPMGLTWEAPEQAGAQFITIKVEIPGVITSERVWPVVVSVTKPDEPLPEVPNAEGTFVDPTLNKKIAVGITAAVGNVGFNQSRDITLTFKDEAGLDKALTSILSATSECVKSGRSQVTAPAIVNNTAVFTYTAKGCVGDDVLSFKATGNAKTVDVGTYKLVTEAEAVGGIVFVSASPTQIPISTTPGSGNLATVTFKVVGQSGNGVGGQQVNFSIVGKAGDVQLVNQSAISDGFGIVTTQVRPGSTPNNVTVLAKVVSTQVSATSMGLAVASGLSAPGKMILSLSYVNPFVFGFDNGGDEASKLSASVADFSGNPVIDGTLVNFTSPEGGLVPATCKTIAGRCSVILSSTGRQPPDGRITVTAYVKGIEDFIDTNGNLLFDDGDIFTPSVHDTYEPFTDLNDDKIYQLDEPFVDSNLNGKRDEPDGKWNGLNCKHSTLCGLEGKLIDIQSSAVIHMTQGYASICQQGTFGVPNSTITLKLGEVRTLTGLYLSDGNGAAINPPSWSPCDKGNSLPGGTKVSFSTTGGATLVAPTDTQEVSPYAHFPNGFSAVIKAPTTAGESVLTMKVYAERGSEKVGVYYTWIIKAE